MIPIADSPRDPNHRPWATLALIFANLAVGVVTLPLAWVPWASETLPAGIPAAAIGGLSRLDEIAFTFGFRPAAPSVLTVATSMFIHASVAHLLGNLLYLWIYGPNVERRLGRASFLLLYATSGLLGAMLFALVSLTSPIPVIGASGAISGVLGAYLVLFPSNTIRLWFYVTSVRIPAFIVLLFFVIVDNLLPFVAHTGSSVAHAAHLGGFFGGMVLATGVRVLAPERRAQAGPGTDPLEVALRLEAQGMILDAHRHLQELAATAAPAVAASAHAHAARIEAHPTYQRTRSR